MSSVYGGSCPSKTMAKKWRNLFKQSKDSLEDDPCRGCAGLEECIGVADECLNWNLQYHWHQHIYDSEFAIRETTDFMQSLGGSLVWFILSLIADMLIVSAIVTPKWLIGPSSDQLYNPPILTASNGALSNESNSHILLSTHPRYPSVGIYTRCKTMDRYGFHCGPFDLDGFATDNSVYPAQWKAAMFFISLGFTILSLTVVLTLITCCRQSAFGKSIHNMTGCAQVLSGISVMLALFLHPLGWGVPRVQLLCGPEAEPFYPAACSIGISFYCATAGAILSFACAGISLKAESSNMRTRVRRRVEEGDRLVCIP